MIGQTIALIYEDFKSVKEVKKVMILETILSKCNKRQTNHKCGSCPTCSYSQFCLADCEKCLDYIHNPSNAPEGFPSRKYDCTHMADFYSCKYSCRYTSEIVYAIERFKDLMDLAELKVLSFGCGPCTDLFAINYLHSKEILNYQKLEYRGVDYSKEVWSLIHKDIKAFETNNLKIKFYYEDACKLINTIAQGTWVPNLIVFQYVFSDMRKHSDCVSITKFINTFAQYYNQKVPAKSYIVLNDINLSTNYGGGREYFDSLYCKLNKSTMRKGRFCDDNEKSTYYPRGYPYGNDSDGEFPCNRNLFDLTQWRAYSPFNTCASAQMLIKKEVEE